MNYCKVLLTLILFIVFTSASFAKNPQVIMSTSKGDLIIELYQKKAPVSVKNFLKYVNSKFYNGTIFHRIIDNFMIQGGGFDQKHNKKETFPPIVNEAGNGLKNLNGTLSMARTSVVNSATSQFFINVKDNSFLDHQNNSPRGFGYAVFGKVIKGMSVVNNMKKTKTKRQGSFANLPITPIFIKSIKIKK